MLLLIYKLAVDLLLTALLYLDIIDNFKTILIDSSKINTS